MEMAEIVERGLRRLGAGPDDRDGVIRAEIDISLQLMKTGIRCMSAEQYAYFIEEIDEKGVLEWICHVREEGKEA